MMPFFSDRAAFSRFFPFAVFMAFIAIDEAARALSTHVGMRIDDIAFYFLYPIKTVMVAALLLRFRKDYAELRWGELANLKQTVPIVVLGILTCIMWVNVNWVPGALRPPQGFDPTLFQNPALRLGMTLFRVAGAVLVVPLMEELFWRSFLLRYLVDQNFEAVPVGRFTFFSFTATAVLFGLEHHFILAGIAAGIIYSLILYRTRSIAQCVLAHAVTNLALAAYVLNTGKWYFW